MIIVQFAQSIKFFELLACIIGFIYWKKLKHSHFKFFPIYLLLIFIGEVVAYFLNKHGYLKEKTMLYDFMIIPLEFLFFHWLYYKTFDKTGKRIVVACSVIYISTVCLEKLFLKDLKTIFMSLSYSIGNITFLIIVLKYFISLVKSDKILNFKVDFLFWVSVAILVFYLGTFPYFGLRNVLIKDYNNIFYDYTWVMIFLNYTMYLLISTGFICYKEK
jgi:hypothetical protein